MKKMLLILSFFALTFFVNGQDKEGFGNDPEGCDSSGYGTVTTWVKPTFECSGTVTIFGEEYPIVQIGDQCWLGKNLHYDDGGDSIFSYNDLSSNSDIYGYLYSWDAANRVDLDISGWHLPSLEELKTLALYYGNYVCGELKESGTNHWLTPNTGATNESNFTSLPGGYLVILNNVKYYKDITEYGNFWSNYEASASHASYRRMVYNSTSFIQGNSPKNLAYSVRLIKD